MMSHAGEEDRGAAGTTTPVLTPTATLPLPYCSTLLPPPAPFSSSSIPPSSRASSPPPRPEPHLDASTRSQSSFCPGPCARRRAAPAAAPQQADTALARALARAGAVAMAGSQQQQIIDTIFSMKRRILRPDDCTRRPPPMPRRP